MLDAKERWQLLDGKRKQVLDRARDCAALTIPSLLPPEGSTQDSPLPTPYQSMGARGVNNLSAKTLLAILPPGQSMFKWDISPSTKMKMGDEAVTKAQQLLAQREQEVTRKTEGLGLRPILSEVFKHLIVTGNALFYKGKDASRFFRLDQYAILRDPSGNPIEAVIKEVVSPLTISDEVALACDVDRSKRDTTVEVYTVIEWNGSKVSDWQEINGKRVPESLSVRPIKKSRWFPLRWTAVPGESYGRGHVEEYLGDLRSLEGLNMAMVQFAAAAAKILFRIRPGSITDFDEIAKLESGQSFTGNEGDVSILQMEKYADFQVTKGVADGLELRLSHAFLLKSGTIRDAERVTAEEIRELAQELEDALGGVYTVLADEFQLPFVRLLVSEMEQAQELKPLPEKAANPVIVTGFQALGRNHSVNKLRAWLADVKELDQNFDTINKDKVARRLGVGYGVEDLDELIKSEEQVANEQQAGVTGNLMEKVAAPIAGQVARGAVSQ